MEKWVNGMSGSEQSPQSVRGRRESNVLIVWRTLLLHAFVGPTFSYIFFRYIVVLFFTTASMLLNEGNTPGWLFTWNRALAEDWKKHSKFRFTRGHFFYYFCYFVITVLSLSYIFLTPLQNTGSSSAFGYWDDFSYYLYWRKNKKYHIRWVCYLFWSRMLWAMYWKR